MKLYDLFLKPYESYTHFQILIEIFATLFGILSVYFSIKRNILIFPTGIVSTSLYVYILFEFGLLGDMLINLYYTIMSIYGWMLWNKNRNQKKDIEVSKSNITDWFKCGILLFVSFLLVTVVYYLKPFFNSSNSDFHLGLYHLDWANWLDVFTTSLFLIGMYLLAKRKIENWLFWIIADLLSIPIYIYKGLGITSIQYILFTIMAIIGYLEWKRTIKFTQNIKIQNQN